MKEKVAIISILANLILASGKIMIGFFANSAAVLAEGIHSLTDIFSSLIGYFGIRASAKPVDEKHPYGHYKFEVLGGLAITVILFATGAGIIYEAVRNIFEIKTSDFSFLVFGVMIFSVAVNYTTSRIKIFYGKKENSLTLISDGVHDKADVAVSLAVLLGLFLNRYWPYADPVLAILIGLYIVKESIPLGKEAIDSLLDVSAGEEIENKIRALVEGEGVPISSLKTQKKGSAVTANIEIKLSRELKVEQASKVSNRLKEKLLKEIDNLQYVVIQIASHDLENSTYKPSFGRSFGWQRKGKFKEKIESASGMGPDGTCLCPKCGFSIEHHRGIPCSTMKCPKCNVILERK